MKPYEILTQHLYDLDPPQATQAVGPYIFLDFARDLINGLLTNWLVPSRRPACKMSGAGHGTSPQNDFLLEVGCP